MGGEFRTALLVKKSEKVWQYKTNSTKRVNIPISKVNKNIINYCIGMRFKP